LPCLVHQNPRGLRRVFTLDPTVMPVSVGRAPGSSIRTTNFSVSRSHGRFALDGEQYVVKDAGSRNGTYVNGARVDGQRVLADGDIVHFGEFPVIFLLDDSRAERVPIEQLASGPVKGHAEASKRKDKSREKEAATGAERVTSRPSPAERIRDLRIAEEPEPGKQPAPRPPIVELPPEEAEPEPKAKPAPKPATPKRPAARKAPRVAAREEPRPAGVEEGQIQRYLDRIAEVTRERDELSAELADLRRQVEQFDRQSARQSAQEGRIELEIEAISERYSKLKEQARRQTELIEELREEISTKDEQVFDSERELSEVRRELEAVKATMDGSADALNDLKVSITQRDRQIEDLQRQLDLTEYDLRAARDEIGTLQSDFNRDGGDLQRLERRSQHLQEILEEKETHVDSLRHELQEKDLEIRQIRMGVGIEDLEDEKRKILEDFYNKSREVEELTATLKEVRFELDEARHANEKLAERVEVLTERRQDITDHPDYKAALRQLAQRTAEVDKLEGARDELSKKLDAFPPEDRGRLEDEIRFLKRKLDATASQLQREKERIPQTEAAPSADVPPEVFEKLSGSYDQWRMNLALLKAYVRNLIEVSDHLPGDASEAVEGLDDLVTILQVDGRTLGEAVAQLTGKEP
jgi:methyl-accepting chemotaxis protein